MDDTNSRPWRQSFVFDLVAFVALWASLGMGQWGEPPVWVHAVYAAGCGAAAVSAAMLRRWFILACFVIAGVIAAREFVNAT